MSDSRRPSRFCLARLSLPVVLTAFALSSQPAQAQVCSMRGGYWGNSNFLYTLYMQPGWTCPIYLDASARILGGGSTTPSCGRWGYTSGRPGFQYQAQNLLCHDTLQIRIQTPDQRIWDYYIVVAVYPNSLRVPGP